MQASIYSIIRYILQKKYRTIDSELKFQITYETENMSRLSIQSLKIDLLIVVFRFIEINIFWAVDKTLLNRKHGCFGNQVNCLSIEYIYANQLSTNDFKGGGGGCCFPW